MGNGSFVKGRYTQAIAKLERAVRLLPGNAQAWNHLGVAYHQSGQYDLALRAYDRARRCDLNLTPVRYNLGCLLLDQNNPQAAAAELTTYMLLQRDSAEGWAKLGTAQLRLRQWSAAERSYKNGLRLRSDLPEAWNGLGFIEVERRRPREALGYFNAALQKHPRYAPAILNVAVVEQYYLHNQAQALQKYREFLQLDPNSRESLAVQENVRQLQAELSPQPREERTAPASTHSASPSSITSNAPVAHDRPQTVADASRPSLSSRRPSPSSELAKSTPAEAVAARESAAAKSRTKVEPVRPVEPEPPREQKRTETAAKAPAEPEPSKPLPVDDSGKSNAEPEVKPEVVQVLEKPPIKVAEDTTAVSVPTNGVSVAANEDISMPTSVQMDRASALLSRKIEAEPAEPAPQEERTRLFDRLNPATWFRARRRSAPSRTVIRYWPTQNAEAKGEPVPGGSDLSPAVPSVPTITRIPRYTYLSPARPAAGNRTKADPIFAEGVQAHRDGRLGDAMEAYRKAVQLDPSFFEAYYNLGLAAYKMRALPESLSAYETALSINPTSVNARYNFALALQRGGYYEDAVAELEKLIQANPDEPRAHLLLARLYAETLGEPALARPHYRKVLELEPQHPEASAIRYWLAANP